MDERARGEIIININKRDKCPPLPSTLIPPRPVNFSKELKESRLRDMWVADLEQVRLTGPNVAPNWWRHTKETLAQTGTHSVTQPSLSSNGR